MQNELGHVSAAFVEQQDSRYHWHFPPWLRARDLSAAEIQAVRNAISHVTQNNPYLARAYYEYYSRHHLYVGGGPLGGGRLMQTTGDSDTEISSTFNICACGRAELGGLLMHELVHTRHSGGSVSGSGDFVEGDAYGVEYAIADRFGAVTRAIAVSRLIEAGGVLGHNTLQLNVGRDRFRLARIFMRLMIDICDNGAISPPVLRAQVVSSINHPLQGIRRTDAQQLVVEFITSGEGSPGGRLNNVLEWIRNNDSVILFYDADHRL
jgi:hypothetical protein